MSSCLIRGVRSVELVASNLEEASRFFETVWGLAPVETRNDSRYFRGTARYHHVLGLHQGTRPAVIRIVFDVADRQAVDALHAKVAAAGAKPGKPAALSAAGGGYGFACKDPDGPTSPSSATAPIMPTPRTSPTGRAASSTSISTLAIATARSASSPARSASASSTRTRRSPSCTAPMPTIARS